MRYDTAGRVATKLSGTFQPIASMVYCGYGIPQQLRDTLALDWTQDCGGGVRIELPYKAICAQRY